MKSKETSRIRDSEMSFWLKNGTHTSDDFSFSARVRFSKM